MVQMLALAAVVLAQASTTCAGGKAGANGAGGGGGVARASGSGLLSLPPSIQRAGRLNKAGACRAGRDCPICCGRL